MGTLPANLAAAYEWIDSASEWPDALKDPNGYSKVAAENYSETHPLEAAANPISAVELIQVIDFMRQNHDPKVIALAIEADCSPEEIEVSRYSDLEFEIGNQTWIVATDSEADDLANERTRETLWAFNSSFLSGYISALRSASAVKAFDRMREELCEGANDLVSAMLGDNLDRCVSDAISADGRGHCLAGYDGFERECSGFYLYRVN